MKTIFIVNPCAGQGKVKNLLCEIENVIEENGADALVYITKSVGDAKEYVENYCKNHGPARFIACGGDGTLSEVVNGAMACREAEVGVVPIGTGNDFCRNFDGVYDFHDVLGQITGSTKRCDAIFYRTEHEDTCKGGYVVNMVNIGFDCNVADLTASMKQKPLISGSMAYLISIFAMLVKKKGANLKIEIDDDLKCEGKLLLSSLANGSYCGGGIKSNPLASVSDGRININIIKNLSRLRFISLLPHYIKGTVLDVKGVERYITSQMCHRVKITPNGGTLRLCIDGEIVDAGETEFEILPNAFRFVLPCG